MIYAYIKDIIFRKEIIIKKNTIGIVFLNIIITFAIYCKKTYNIMEKSKKKTAKVLVTNTNTVTDKDTGEILSQERSTKLKQVEREPNYIKLYTDDIGRLFNLPGSSSEVLAAIASHMAYKTNIIVLYGPIKKVIMAELGMNINTFNKAIDDLYKAGMLIRLSRACYMVDPELYGSGSWQDVKKVRLSIEYNADGTKSVTTELTKNIDGEKQTAIEQFHKQVKNKSLKQKQLTLFDNE